MNHINSEPSVANWETVGKAKKPKSESDGKSKANKDKKKNFIDNAPKLEDILPLSQVASLFNIFDLDKPSEKPADANKENGTDSLLQKKAAEQKKIQLAKKKAAEKKEILKEKPPKSLPEAVKRINEDEISELIGLVKLRFHESPLLWLKDLASYLNLKLNVELTDPVFSSKPHDYPLILLPDKTRKIFQKVVMDSSTPILEAFFHACLTNMAHDMSKGLTTNGYRLFIQMVAYHKPEVCISAIPLIANTLWNSYQNRQPIGLSLLWAIGQGGFTSASTGMRIWLNALLPYINLRNYNRYILDYLSLLLFHHSRNCNSLISPEEYFAMFDIVYGITDDINPNYKQEISKLYPKLKSVTFGRKLETRFRTLFPFYLQRLTPTCSADTKQELCSCLMECLLHDKHCFTQWIQHYQKNLRPSAVLLTHINEVWGTLDKSFPVKTLENCVIEMKKINEVIGKKKSVKSEALRDCVEQCQLVSAKFRRGFSFPWRFASTILAVIIGFLISYDIQKSKGWGRSSLAMFLNDMGLLVPLHTFVGQVQVNTLIAISWIKKNAPQYYAIMQTYVGPYIKTAWNGIYIAFGYLSDVMANIGAFVRVKTPILMQSLNDYFPGLSETIQHYSWELCLLLNSVWFAILQFVTHYIHIVFNWLDVNVFVGDFSFENLGKYALAGCALVQAYALKAFQWIAQQIKVIYP